jgi:hypothetical protein
MRRNFGRFAEGGIVDEPEMFGNTSNIDTPSILGASLPDTGIRNKGMGDVFPPKEKFTPQQFADKNAAMKRIKQTPGQSPLGPLTSGPPKGLPPQGGMPPRRQGPPGQGQPPQKGELGGRWMGELWQGLTTDMVDPRIAPPQLGGYASGGAVDSGMRIYNQTTRDLESGGVGGYAQGGMVGKSQEVAAQGRGGDSMLMHIQPEELAGLESLLGPTTTNPETGNPEGFLWAPVLIGLAIGATAGGVSAHLQGGNAGDIALGALGGGTVGALTGGIAGAGAGVGGAAVSGAPIAASGTSLASTTAIPTGGGLAGISGLTWGPAAGGIAPVTVGGAGTAVPAAVASGAAAPLNLGGAARFAASTAPSLLGMGSSGEQAAPPPPPQMSRPAPRAGHLASPNDSRRARGIASLQRPPNNLPSGRIGRSLRGRGIA